jgi:hypothetical protein
VLPSGLFNSVSGISIPPPETVFNNRGSETAGLKLGKKKYEFQIGDFCAKTKRIYVNRAFGGDCHSRAAYGDTVARTGKS